MEPRRVQEAHRSFLTSVNDGGERADSFPGRLNSGK